ncbi:T4 gp25-like baseplate wedge protein [Halorubrum tailed virus 25]|uniref:T4 gp25-like baseplate wedge protein n=1 Tax=Halorubrum tailed virus 25 TaxID=2878006 RepID=A0AAE8XYQ8_9CAUD|nr:T4 gp25-like baseplate wedge protein [Halorubrum tailed virus 25]UBF22612.1 T4 gp25-like baseplate wedge protein [Halorubrum tailed virus 25]
MDIGLNKNFDLELGGRNDVFLVRGREEFEQRLRLSVVSFFQRIIGNTNRETVLQLIEVQAKRVAQEYDEIEQVAQIQVEYDDERPNTINLTFIYDTGEEFTFPVSE